MIFFINFVRTSPNTNIIYITQLMCEIRTQSLILLIFFHDQYCFNLDCEVYFILAGLSYFRILVTNCHITWNFWKHNCKQKPAFWACNSPLGKRVVEIACADPVLARAFHKSVSSKLALFCLAKSLPSFMMLWRRACLTIMCCIAGLIIWKQA